MSITISPQQREALYGQIFDRMSGIGDVWLAVCAENYDAAERLGREYSDDLRLVVDDLGWGEGTGEAVELTTPPDVLRRVFTRLRASTAGLREYEEQSRAEDRDYEERSRVVLGACRMVLASLEGEPSQ